MVGGKPLLWPLASLPIAFAFAKGTPPGIQTACRNAGETFNESAGRTLFRFTDEEVTVPKDLDVAFGRNVITYGLLPRSSQTKSAWPTRSTWADGSSRFTST